MGNVRTAFVYRQLLSCLRGTGFLILFITLTGCETLSFYQQLASGQVDILMKRQPVESLLQNTSLDKGLREQLLKVRDIQTFATSELGFSSQGSFTTFVDLKRDYVLWNVYIAEAYAVQSVNRCYPLVGCVPYRGYFSKDQADGYARKMSEEKGLETYVGGVPAYSTLGWFKDPILSTFVDWEDQQLASLIIHELLHQNIWVKGDARFNEGLASFVGNRGATIWSRKIGSTQDSEGFIESQKQWRLFKQFVVVARKYLEIQYSASKDLNELNVIKSTAMGNIRSCYRELSLKFLDGRYDKFVFGEQFNNAFIASIGVYESHRLAFKRLFDLAAHDWTDFFEKVKGLIVLDQEARHSKLRTLSDDEITGQTDDGNAHQIHCETF